MPLPGMPLACRLLYGAPEAVCGDNSVAGGLELARHPRGFRSMWVRGLWVIRMWVMCLWFMCLWVIPVALRRLVGVFRV